MKAALSLTFVLALMTAALPATAQERVVSLESAGLLPGAMMLEAVRLAVESQDSDDVEWLHVRKLAAGTKIIVTVKGSQPVERYFMQADESHCTVSVTASREGVAEIARTDIIEIKDRVIHRGSFRDAGIGAGLGAAVASALILKTNAGYGVTRARFTLVGLSFGGGVLGYYASSHTTEHIIYHAP